MAKELDHAVQPSLTNSYATSLDLENYPYLQRLDKLQYAYPPLRSLLDKLRNTGDEGRRLVIRRYGQSPSYAGLPGRCAVLRFHHDHVEETTFYSAGELETYLRAESLHQTSASKERRLFILEDLEPGFVDVLGQQLGVDPLVFSEQMNTWNTTDSHSVPHRALPSLRSAEKSFTLRYYELRTLDDEESIRTDKFQMTHAINRRRIERWRDVDLDSIEPDKRHAFIRRCASFWTSQETSNGQALGWDAVMLVDPPFNSCATCARHNKAKHPRNKSRAKTSEDGTPSSQCEPSCLILEGNEATLNRKKLWNSRRWIHPGDCCETRHNSIAYHGGCTSLVPPTLSTEDSNPDVDVLGRPRNMASPFDELVLYWTKSAEPSLLAKVHESSVNSAFFLLKFIAQQWSNQLELIGYGVANTEWFADDHEATIDTRSTLTDWKEEIHDIASKTKDINYMRRQMSHFERAITLNIERLGVQLGSPAVNENLPVALKDAQGDFLTISARLTPFRERVDDLSSIANEIASLRAAFKSLKDGEQGLRLSLFASIIFPLTLIASMFSMADGYLPGQENFFVFWAASIPLAFVIGIWLMYGHAPERWARLGYQRIKPLIGLKRQHHAYDAAHRAA